LVRVLDFDSIGFERGIRRKILEEFRATHDRSAIKTRKELKIMKKRMIIIALVVASVFGFMAGSSQAVQIAPQQISGNIWTVNSYPNDLSLATFSALSAPAASFTVSAINFNGNLPNGQVESYDAWLSNGGANIVVWNDPGSASFGAGNFQTGPENGNPDVASLIQFTGSAFFPENFSITKDDGFELYLGNTLVCDASGATAPSTVSITLPAGMSPGIYSFTLDYAGWNGFPEVLTESGVRPVPIPPTAYLFVTGLVGLYGIGRRRFKK